jgi:GAF domain-containing protein
MPDDTQLDLRQTAAELRRQVDELAAELRTRTAERDEALAREAAIGEVLQVINFSPGDLAPVLQAIVEKAHALCDADYGSLQLWDGEKFRGVAMRGFPDMMVAALKQGYSPLDMPCQPLIEGERVAHCVDLAKIDSPTARKGVALSGIRTILYVALRKDDTLLGQIVAARREVRPFTEKQIALLQNFAAQAVVAMENARLLTETREALEQQTAAAEVLQVINSSPGDLGPVFDVMVERAAELCEADEAAVRTFDGESLQLAAAYGEPQVFERLLQLGPSRLNRSGGLYDRIARGERVTHIADVRETDTFRDNPAARKRLELRNIRTWLAVPLRKEGALLGVINVHRHEVRPFSDKQIALLQNFAAQAVIAIENARLLGELRERTENLQQSLEYQTAISDVLQVISRSVFDLDAVLQTVVTTAVQLCRGQYGVIFRNDGAEYRFAAGFGNSPEYEEHERQSVIRPGRGTIIGRAALEGCVVQIADALTDPDYEDKEGARLNDAHTMIGVPLLRDGLPVGVIGLARNRVEPFSDKEVALVSTFADQAVIAIHNTRLLSELQARTRDLEESLEYQTATSDVLKVISRSTSDVQPVLDTVVEIAARLCGNDTATILIGAGEVYRFVANYGVEPEFWATLRQRTVVPGRDTVTARTALEGRVVHVADILADPDYASPENVAAGLRTCLGVPLLRKGAVLGTINLGRKRVEPFTERQIELVRTFADQAVIAMENARLLGELRESLEQQQAIAELLQVINSSPGDLTPVFNAILDKAHALCGATRGTLFLFDGETFRAAAAHGYPPGASLPNGIKVSEDVRLAALLAGERLVHVADLTEVDDPIARAVAARGGVRTNLLLPLRKESTLLGVISCNRPEVRPFSEKEIALLESFAAQAVIAIDNARLLNEIRQRQAELRVTFDNMADGVAMFDAELRLAAWNRNFQQILDLSDQLLAERPSLEGYIRYLAERGEYGAEVDPETEVQRLMGMLGSAWAMERTRPDGRVIEVRHNPVPGGGIVLIYSDVTERKRAEAEIRAACDAAEKALAELKTAQASLIHAEKMASLGQLTAGIAHEIKNPLNFVNNFAGLSVELLDELKDMAEPGFAALDADTRGEVDETIQMLSGNLDKIAEHGRRADGIVQSMLLHSRGGSGERRQVDLNALVDEALNLAYHGARAQDPTFNITLEREFAEPLALIELVPQDMTRVFLNLIGNGFHAAQQRCKTAKDAGFNPVLKVATRDLGDAVEIAVHDNGTGILPEHRDRLFQPFFTTKPTGQGTGLGLSISYDIVTQEHGGTIEVDSEPSVYTEFKVRLPRLSNGRSG